jgi:hypothetical protein
MITLSLTSVETCIMAAFASYTNQLPGTITVPTPDGNINVTCVLNQGRFNCGFPGYLMDHNNAPALQAWCVNNPGLIGGRQWSFGFRGTDPTHQNSVNVTLIDFNPLMFNFHVNMF